MLEVHTTPPHTEADLLKRVDRLAGHTLGEVAQGLGWDVPPNLKTNKGWVGQLIETWLGATAGNRAVPDFEALGIELKTLPVDLRGKPLESTYVSTMELAHADDVEWATCSVRAKLQRVLWVPVQAERTVPLSERMIGRAVLWSPTSEEEEGLQKDWESHMRAVRDGCVDAIRGSDGRALQVRPKAADSSVLTWGVDSFGGAILTSPRGFYLRAVFTEYVLQSRLREARHIAQMPDSED